MATSYTNPGGSGDRAGIVSVAHSFATIGTAVLNLTNGSFGTNSGGSCWLNADEANTGQRFRFDFGAGIKKIIDEIKWYQSPTIDNHGTYQVQGSNVASPSVDADWTNIGSTFILGNFAGPAPQVITAISGNAIGYRHYALWAVPGGGTTRANPYLIEIEFKIADDIPPLAPHHVFIDEAVFPSPYPILTENVFTVDPMVDDAVMTAIPFGGLMILAGEQTMVDDAVMSALPTIPDIILPRQMIVINTGGV